jgi:Spy/CpxP family protein refolding chaperone
MRKATLTVMATLALVIMFALSTAVAMAGWGYEDCPPASIWGATHSSDQAGLMVSNLNPPANAHATTLNPGNKAGN